jgi:hypothetical protein
MVILYKGGEGAVSRAAHCVRRDFSRISTGSGVTDEWRQALGCGSYFGGGHRAGGGVLEQQQQLE